MIRAVYIGASNVGRIEGSEEHGWKAISYCSNRELGVFASDEIAECWVREERYLVDGLVRREGNNKYDERAK